MGFNIQQTEDELQSSAIFQRNAELTGISLVECRCSASEALASTQGALRLNLKNESDVRPVTERTASFIVRLTVHGQPADLPANAEAPALQVSGSFALSYQLKPEYEPKADEMDAFKDGNAVFNCWPYFREFVQSMCSRMGLQIAPVPLLRLVPPSASATPPAPVPAQPKRVVPAKRAAKPRSKLKSGA